MMKNTLTIPGKKPETMIAGVCLKTFSYGIAIVKIRGTKKFRYNPLENEGIFIITCLKEGKLSLNTITDEILDNCSPYTKQEKLTLLKNYYESRNYCEHYTDSSIEQDYYRCNVKVECNNKLVIYPNDDEILKYSIIHDKFSKKDRDCSYFTLEKPERNIKSLIRYTGLMINDKRVKHNIDNPENYDKITNELQHLNEDDDDEIKRLSPLTQALNLAIGGYIKNPEYPMVGLFVVPPM